MPANRADPAGHIYSVCCTLGFRPETLEPKFAHSSWFFIGFVAWFVDSPSEEDLLPWRATGPSRKSKEMEAEGPPNDAHMLEDGGSTEVQQAQQDTTASDEPDDTLRYDAQPSLMQTVPTLQYDQATGSAEQTSADTVQTQTMVYAEPARFGDGDEVGDQTLQYVAPTLVADASEAAEPSSDHEAEAVRPARKKAKSNKKKDALNSDDEDEAMQEDAGDAANEPDISIDASGDGDKAEQDAQPPPKRRTLRSVDDSEDSDGEPGDRIAKEKSGNTTDKSAPLSRKEQMAALAEAAKRRAEAEGVQNEKSGHDVRSEKKKRAGAFKKTKDKDESEKPGTKRGRAEQKGSYGKAHKGRKQEPATKVDKAAMTQKLITQQVS